MEISIHGWFRLSIGDHDNFEERTEKIKQRVEEDVEAFFDDDLYCNDSTVLCFKNYFTMEIDAYGITEEIEMKFDIDESAVPFYEVIDWLMDHNQDKDIDGDTAYAICVERFTEHFISLINAFFNKNFNDILNWNENDLFYYDDKIKYCVAHLVISGFGIDKKCEEYLKENYINVLHTLIDEDNEKYVEKFLAIDLIQEKDIHEIISYAVEHTQKTGNAESQLMIMEYISQHFDGTDPTRFNL